MSLLSSSCVYGLRAALYVAGRAKGRSRVPIREIAEELGLSFHFLTKILQRLTACGVMSSERGPKGGVALARPAASISLLDVVEGIEGPDFFGGCVLGLAGCGDRAPCPMHARWVEERKRLKKLFGASRLDELGSRVAAAGVRLTD